MTASWPHLLRYIVTLAAAAAAAQETRTQCEPDNFYDLVVHRCTPCAHICDPARGTYYLCFQHIDVCKGKQNAKIQSIGILLSVGIN